MTPTELADRMHKVAADLSQRADAVALPQGMDRHAFYKEASVDAFTAAAMLREAERLLTVAWSKGGTPLSADVVAWLAGSTLTDARPDEVKR